MFGAAVTRRRETRPPMLLEKRGPIETLPGRNAETDRVREGISEGFHWQSLEGSFQGREGGQLLAVLDIRDFESTGSVRSTRLWLGITITGVDWKFRKVPAGDR